MAAIREAEDAPDVGIATERAALGRAAIVSIRTAARWLGGERAKAMAWLRASGLVRRHPITGKEVVNWGRVLDRIYEDEPEVPAAAPAREAPRARGNLPRVPLGPRR